MCPLNFHVMVKVALSPFHLGAFVPYMLLNNTLSSAQNVRLWYIYIFFFFFFFFIIHNYTALRCMCCFVPPGGLYVYLHVVSLSILFYFLFLSRSQQDVCAFFCISLYLFPGCTSVRTFLLSRTHETFALFSSQQNVTLFVSQVCSDEFFFFIFAKKL